MDRPDRPTEDRHDAADPPATAPGLGLNAVELGARRGIGPLSDLAAEAWHGQSKPCVSCGQLVRRTATACDLCGQDLSPRMLWTMQKHAGPWYVLEHVRPFPGVKIERLIRQIRRGVLTATTIVRGPTTFGQWRYAAETPGLSKYLGLCWRCQGPVQADDVICRACRVTLDGISDVFFDAAQSDASPTTPEPPPPTTTSAPGPPEPPKIRFAHQARTPGYTNPPGPEPVPPTVGAAVEAGLDELSAAVGADETLAAKRTGAASMRIAGIHVGWIIGALVLMLIAALCAVIWLRSKELAAQNRTAAAVWPAPAAAAVHAGAPR